jgi:hypothetical protein
MVIPRKMVFRGIDPWPYRGYFHDLKGRLLTANPWQNHRATLNSATEKIPGANIFDIFD